MFVKESLTRIKLWSGNVKILINKDKDVVKG